MSHGVIYSFSEPLSSWSEGAALATVYGPKGARLLCLPRAWTPAFALVPATAAESLISAGDGDLEGILRPLLGLPESTGKVIVRSSVIGETIWDRGTYRSRDVDATPSNIPFSQLRSAVSDVIASAGERNAALILQAFILRREWGEFGNLQRVSKTRDHWELSIQAIDGTYRTSRFNSQRDVALPVTDALEIKSGLSRERFFGSIGAWLNNELVRGTRDRVNCEWVRSDNGYFLVQIDAEDEDIYGINPMQIYIPPSIVPKNRSCKIVRFPNDTDIKTWDKLKVLDDLWEKDGIAKPSLYFLPISTIADKVTKKSLCAELEAVFERDIVVRTSVRSGHEKLTNLPRSGCMSPADTASWCIRKSRELVNEYPNVEFAFVLHRYIASAASAWVRAEPENPVVEVHGNWGLPDALQYYPYDIWEVHVPKEEVIEYPDYKSDVIFPDTNGEWRHERVNNIVARYQSLNRGQILDVAKRTLEIVQRLKKPCHVMWFVGCKDISGTSLNVPWYWTEAHDAETNPERGNPSWFVVRGYKELTQIQTLKAARRNLAISLLPETTDLLRDNKFLNDLADIIQPLDVPVSLHGSTLAHAYYQLRRRDCTIIAAGEKQHLRTRHHETFGKLVRDKIPERIAKNKEQQMTAILPPDSRVPFLIAKFVEELLEVREAQNERQKLEELSDVYEVFRALVKNYHADMASIIEKADRKREKVGGFEEGQFLLETSLPTKKREGLKRSSLAGSLPMVKKIDGKIYKIPFTYFGFAEIGRPLSIFFEDEKVFFVIVLRNDCIEISVQEQPEQLKLDFDFPLNLGANESSQ